MSDENRIELPCRDAAGRPKSLTVSLVDGELCLTTPPPSAFMNWHEADQLRAALDELRLRMPGAPS